MWLKYLIILVFPIAAVPPPSEPPESSTEDQAEDTDVTEAEKKSTTSSPGVTTELTQDNLEWWIIQTAREHPMNQSSMEDTIPGNEAIKPVKSKNETTTASSATTTAQATTAAP